jgi:hypothetical protein
LDALGVGALCKGYLPGCLTPGVILGYIRFNKNFHHSAGAAGVQESRGRSVSSRGVGNRDTALGEVRLLGETQSGAAGRTGIGSLILFTAATFLSAVLLFSIQPMFAKMVLPMLGGSPSVWAVALLFFQGALLAGYLYAHLLIRFFPGVLTGFVHLAFCLVAFIVLPISVPGAWSDPPPGDPYIWQLSLFAAAIGLPFAAVAANAPLLQAWFARAGHAQSADPYFLYAASNLGSLIALLGYPFVLEPVFGLKALSLMWAGGFGLLLVFLVVCFVTVRAGHARDDRKKLGSEIAFAARPRLNGRLHWVWLAVVPSALLTAFTTHIATDVASAPLIWVVPLSLYLLTFVLVFRERVLIPMPILLAVHLAAVVAALLQLAQTHHDKWPLTASLGVAAFFTSALVAHRTLYLARPAARYLTEFYLWMSCGGALGGLFAALVAPKIFSEVFEYPLLLALTFSCRPGVLGVIGERNGDRLRLAFLLSFGVLLTFWVPWAAERAGVTFWGWGAAPVLVLAAGAATVLCWRYPRRQLVLCCLMFLSVAVLPSGVHRGAAQRSYFGVYRVLLVDDGQFNVLKHGTTLHGAQRVKDVRGRPANGRVPITYYHSGSPMTTAVGIVGRGLAAQDVDGRFGVIGLGAGSLACHSAPNETWRFFEIDPLVVAIAKSPQFTYLANCQPDADIVLGDARLTFGREQDESFDLLIVDAFSSDAIPMHLLTVEALSLYASKLKPSGIGVLHISNRYLDLEAVLGSTLPSAGGLHALVIEDTVNNGYDAIGSTVVVFGKTQMATDHFRAVPGARNLARSPLRPWTDDASDVLGPFLSQYRKVYGTPSAGGMQTGLVAPGKRAR